MSNKKKLHLGAKLLGKGVVYLVKGVVYLKGGKLPEEFVEDFKVFYDFEEVPSQKEILDSPKYRALIVTAVYGDTIGDAYQGMKEALEDS